SLAAIVESTQNAITQMQQGWEEFQAAAEGKKSEHRKAVSGIVKEMRELDEQIRRLDEEIKLAEPSSEVLLRKINALSYLNTTFQIVRELGQFIPIFNLGLSVKQAFDT